MGAYCDAASARSMGGDGFTFEHSPSQPCLLFLYRTNVIDSDAKYGGETAHSPTQSILGHGPATDVTRCARRVSQTALRPAPTPSQG